MKSLDELTAFYNQELFPDINKLEVQRKKIVAKLSLYIPPVCLITLILAYIVRDVEKAPGIVIGLGVFSVIGIYFFLTQSYVSYFKDLVISRIVKFIDSSLNYNKGSYVPKSEFEASKVSLTKPNLYSGDDRVQGKIGQTVIDFSEIHARYETGSGKNRRVQTLFKGLFFKADFNKHFQGETFVLPDVAERSFGSIGTIFQKMQAGRPPLVKLEDPEFEQLFVIYSTDQIEARYILSTSLMKRIADFKKKSGRAIYLSFIHSHVYVAICDSRNLFEPRVFQTLLDFEPIREYFEDLQLAIGIVEDLNLNLRIWSKE